MDCTDILFSGHALRRMFERQIPQTAVREVLTTGEVIADYPEDRPYPSVLLLGWPGGQPLHLVASRAPEDGTCYVITVYAPDPRLWNEDFRSRR